ncbi:unnamed protein product [Blepharisma stoltei]|uniref:Protein kinase domain-containing protein n=1 Tax=Blepharisma stoltei TaxID=1481888 RepID=A0AAU9IM12_9CILI|nr:unnamed protein product [Blepharisma stoltei]
MIKTQSPRKHEIRNLLIQRTQRIGKAKTGADKTKKTAASGAKDSKISHNNPISIKYTNRAPKTLTSKNSLANTTVLSDQMNFDSLEEFTSKDKDGLEKMMPHLQLKSPGFLRQNPPDEPNQKQEIVSSISSNKLAQICSPLKEAGSSILKNKTQEENEKSPTQICFGPRLRFEQVSHSDQNTARQQVEEKEGTVDSYIIGNQIGKGAYAIVKEGIHKETNKKVAIKIYDKLSLLEPNKKKNVQRETRILSKLNHEFIVKLHETVETPSTINLVQEFVDGCSLHDYIRKMPGRKLQEDEAKRIFKEIMQAVCYFHSRNVSHRDIKLENILLTSQLKVKIIDFGFAILLSDTKKIKAFCGTPSYMAPEIVMKKEYLGQPADIWACGILLYVLLSGEFPFRAAHHGDLYIQIQRGFYVMPETISEGAKQLIQKMLNYDPNLRSTAKSVLEEPWFQS